MRLPRQLGLEECDRRAALLCVVALFTKCNGWDLPVEAAQLSEEAEERCSARAMTARARLPARQLGLVVTVANIALPVYRVP
jgi:hypothetical protein